MNKVWLIIKKEFLSRVQKRTFLIATIVVPLIFPAIIGGMMYLMIKDSEKGPAQVMVVDESKKFVFNPTDQFNFVPLNVSLNEAKKIYTASESMALLYIPRFELNKPEGFKLFSKENPGMEKMGALREQLEGQIREMKMDAFGVDKEVLEAIKAGIRLDQITIQDSGKENESNGGLLYGVGMASGILIYLLVLIYGMQIMMGVIEEKSSKVVEIIISSVRPFQLMLGKIIGIAAVGLLQFIIWIVIVTVATSAITGSYQKKLPQQQMVEQMQKASGGPVVQPPLNEVDKILSSVNELPLLKIVLVFLFYFLGGYLLYGALFAALGASVDTVQEAQQFQMPVTLPLLIGYLGLFTFILRDPHAPVSVWLSIIPLTSPVAMVGRIAYGVPAWQLILSMALLAGGFLFTTWLAGRIFRIGILMTGTKVNWKVLWKWATMKF